MSTITKTDAAELKALVNQRRELLHEQLSARRNEIRNAVEGAILAGHRAEIEAAEKEIAKFRRRAKALEADALEFVDSLPADLESVRGRWDDPIDVTFHLEVKPRDLKKRVNAAVAKTEEQYAIEKVNLNKRFVDLREELVTMSFDGDAKAFLGRIPTVDEILPLPNGDGAELKALVAA